MHPPKLFYLHFDISNLISWVNPPSCLFSNSEMVKILNYPQGKCIGVCCPINSSSDSTPVLSQYFLSILPLAHILPLSPFLSLSLLSFPPLENASYHKSILSSWSYEGGPKRDLAVGRGERVVGSNWVVELVEVELLSSMREMGLVRRTIF